MLTNETKVLPKLINVISVFYCQIFQVNSSRDWHRVLVCYLTSHLSSCLEAFLIVCELKVSIGQVRSRQLEHKENKLLEKIWV